MPTAPSAADIVAHFEWYDFTDPLGHRLTDCREFLELVEQAVAVAGAVDGGRA